MCLSFDLEDNSLVVNNEIKLPTRDEFDGKLFIYLDDENMAQFSLLVVRVYIFVLHFLLIFIINYIVDE
jgi:hypothetical protein